MCLGLLPPVKGWSEKVGTSYTLVGTAPKMLPATLSLLAPFSEHLQFL